MPEGDPTPPPAVSRAPGFEGNVFGGVGLQATIQINQMWREEAGSQRLDKSQVSTQFRSQPELTVRNSWHNPKKPYRSSREHGG
jgi:hypothetical protein